MSDERNPVLIRWDFSPMPLAILPGPIFFSDNMAATECLMRYEDWILGELCGEFGKVKSWAAAQTEIR